MNSQCYWKEEVRNPVIASTYKCGSKISQLVTDYWWGHTQKEGETRQETFSLLHQVE